MQLGIAIEDTWQFLHEIYEDLAAHHQVTVFKRRQIGLPIFNARINHRLFRRDFQAFLRAQDVVFFEWASGLLAAASHLPKTCGIVTRLHRYELYQWADKINWDAVDKIILVSEAKRAEFARRFPAQADKIEVVYEAADLTKFQFNPKPFRGDIGILCHLRPRKRVYELILAFYDLVGERPSLHLHIGGGGAAGFHEYPIALRRLVEKLNLQDNVTFYGNVDNPAEWYKQIDVFVSNGYSEGLQVSLIEAMASGCYAISHRWDGVEELLPDEALYYTEEQMQTVLRRYFELPEGDKQQAIANFRQIVERQCDVFQTRTQIRQIIEGVAAR
ncbi:MAG TPA: glycosyltransferase [Anaerolineae bacterium]|nr:glycosyltransferase [Anaerolineae bacterium]